MLIELVGRRGGRGKEWLEFVEQNVGQIFHCNHRKLQHASDLSEIGKKKKKKELKTEIEVVKLS